MAYLNHSGGIAPGTLSSKEDSRAKRPGRFKCPGSTGKLAAIADYFLEKLNQAWGCCLLLGITAGSLAYFVSSFSPCWGVFSVELDHRISQLHGCSRYAGMDVSGRQ
jgi:hypothetical protein